MPLIAVMNDDTAFLQLMQEALVDEGYRVRLHFTTDGVEDAIAQEHLDLMILDIVMELRDAGLRLLYAIRQRRELDDLPVIVSSADAVFLREHAEELASLQCVVIEKPFDLDALYTKIAAMIHATPDAQAH